MTSRWWEQVEESGDITPQDAGCLGWVCVGLIILTLLILIALHPWG